MGAASSGCCDGRSQSDAPSATTDTEEKEKGAGSAGKGAGEDGKADALKYETTNMLSLRCFLQKSCD